LAGAATQVGLPSVEKIDEALPDRPVTVYDRHKLAAEALLKEACAEGTLRGACLRLCNVYGPGPKSSSADRGVLNAMIRRALKGEPVTAYDRCARLRRDYVFVDDAAEAFAAAAEAPDAVNGRHFLVASGEAVALKDAFALAAARASARTGRRVPVALVPAPEGLSPIEGRDYAADPGALKKAAGWAPRVALSQGIDLTIDAFLKEAAPREAAA
jgi:nucleoside-diphosphate-sugar epimerase